MVGRLWRNECSGEAAIHNDICGDATKTSFTVNFVDLLDCNGGRVAREDGRLEELISWVGARIMMQLSKQDLARPGQWITYTPKTSKDLPNKWKSKPLVVRYLMQSVRVRSRSFSWMIMYMSTDELHRASPSKLWISREGGIMCLLFSRTGQPFASSFEPSDELPSLQSLSLSLF